MYALGFIITHEAMKDNQYEKVGMQRTGNLAFSMRQTKENVVANLYNRAFNSSYVGADGKELLATDHPSARERGRTSWPLPRICRKPALEDLVVQIMQATNSRGMKIALRPAS
jgi:hypothetical protein